MRAFVCSACCDDGVRFTTFVACVRMFRGGVGSRRGQQAHKHLRVSPRKHGQPSSCRDVSSVSNDRTRTERRRDKEKNTWAMTDIE